jgi:hypothetical protein
MRGVEGNQNNRYSGSLLLSLTAHSPPDLFRFGTVSLIGFLLILLASSAAAISVKENLDNEQDPAIISEPAKVGDKVPGQAATMDGEHDHKPPSRETGVVPGIRSDPKNAANDKSRNFDEQWSRKRAAPPSQIFPITFYVLITAIALVSFCLRRFR